MSSEVAKRVDQRKASIKPRLDPDERRYARSDRRVELRADVREDAMQKRRTLIDSPQIALVSVASVQAVIDAGMLLTGTDMGRRVTGAAALRTMLCNPEAAPVAEEPVPETGEPEAEESSETSPQQPEAEATETELESDD